MFEPISPYNNYFVGVDGEGIGDDYVLIDSSLPDYPRLVTGERLTNLQCLDWVWGLGKHAGYATFCLYGAGYDFNNWMRGIPFDDVQRFASAKPVRVGNYIVIWQPHFKFEVRKIRDEDTSQPEYAPRRYQYERIATRIGDERSNYSGLAFWDVLPWWQCKFTKALDMTLKEHAIDRELIEAGKLQRGSFTWDNIEWVSKYNKTECLNLAWMMVELDKWFASVDIRPQFYNGPGSAAKAMLKQYAPYQHAGRRIAWKEKSVSQKVRDYIYPGADNNHAMSQRALAAYAGALNRQLQIGWEPDTLYQYDIVSAYPYVTRNLPCLSHGEWTRTREFDGQSFGLWRVRYRATRTMSCYPFFWRSQDGSIEYPHTFDERWCHTAEVVTGMAVDARGITILDGWKWVPHACDNPYPFWWVTNAFHRRASFKAKGNEGASNALKLPLNSLYGSIAQATGGTLGQPPWSQQLLWAGAITAKTRARLYLAYSINPDAVVHMATDGIITSEPLGLRVGKELGDWELTHLYDTTVVQYGVYMARRCDCGKHEGWHHRERGFQLREDEVEPFVNRVHDLWRTGQWVSMAVQQKLFVTAGLVAMSEARYDDWCHWHDVTKEIELDKSTIFQAGKVKNKPWPSLWPIVESSRSTIKSLPASKQYIPHWGKGENFPREWRKEDEFMQAIAMEG